MRTTEIITISLPLAILEQCEALCKKESRTRSELVREAIRVYIEARYPAIQPTKKEMAILRKGHAEFQRGDFALFENYLKRDVASRGNQIRTKRPRSIARKGAATH